MASGDFSPNHRVVLQFDTLTLADGRNVPIRTREAGTAEHITLAMANPTQSGDDVGTRARLR